MSTLDLRLLNGKRDAGKYKALLIQAHEAGWRIERRKNGYMVYPPNGYQAFLVHTTYGSDKAYRNVRSLFRRGGLDV